MKRIGILGGASNVATADYYRRLNEAVNARLGGFNTAEQIVSSKNFALIERWVREDAWDEAGPYLAERAQALERAGAELLLCVSHTLHRVADVFMAGVRGPLLHIADPTAAAVRNAGLTRRAARYGAGQRSADRITFEELVRGRFTPEARAAPREWCSVAPRYRCCSTRPTGPPCRCSIPSRCTSPRRSCSRSPLLKGRGARLSPRARGCRTRARCR